jgi:hypothetical protein
MTHTEVLAKLNGRDGQAQKVRRWAARHSQRCHVSLATVLWAVADELWNAELTPRDTTPAKERQRKAAQIAALALKLAEAIETSPEYFLPALSLLDEEAADELCKIAKTLEPIPTCGLTAAIILAVRFPKQEVPSLLRNLARQAERIPEPRDSRPTVASAPVRIAARGLRRMFSRIPVPVIAAAIETAWPTVEADPDAIKMLLARKR